MHIVNNGGAKRVHCTVEQTQRYRYVIFCGPESKGFEKDDGDRHDAEEGADRSVSEIVGVQTIDNNFEDVAACIHDLADVVPVVAVPLYQRAEGNCRAVISRVRRDTMRLGVRLQRRIVGASFNNRLQS
jgi:hypothetical protein